MIDGCTPIQTFFQVVFPIMKPTVITVAILQAMWIWNDYLLPYLVAIIPIIIFYGICQKYIIEGVVAGAVKG